MLPLQVYCGILVIALAAAVPRKKTRLLTAAGAGALSTYNLQGFGLPVAAPLIFRILDRLFPLDAMETSRHFSLTRTVLAIGALIALLFAYAVLSSALVARVITAATTGPRWKYRFVMAILAILALEVHGRGEVSVLPTYQAPQPTRDGWRSLNVTSPPNGWSEPFFLQNSVFGRVNLAWEDRRPCCTYLGMVDSLQACVAAARNYTGGGKHNARFMDWAATSITWYREDSGIWARTCFASIDGKERPEPFQPGQPRADSVRNLFVRPHTVLKHLTALFAYRKSRVLSAEY